MLSILADLLMLFVWLSIPGGFLLIAELIRRQL